MNLLQYVEEKQQQVKTIVAVDELNVVNVGRILTEIRNVLSEVKEFIREYEFKSEQEEIHFFKSAKPVLLSSYIYHKKLFKLLLFDSFRDGKSRIANYQRVLKKMQSFNMTNSDFYQYCISGTTYLDEQYFTRNIKNRHHSDIRVDERFSCYYDIKFAKLLAYQALTEFINQSIEKLKLGNDHGNLPQLQWTVSKVSLIEMIYALHACGVFNYGKIEIKQIIKAFEQLLHIDVGNYAKVFSEIRMRKKGQILFIDQMKERLAQQIKELE